MSEVVKQKEQIPNRFISTVIQGTIQFTGIMVRRLNISIAFFVFCFVLFNPVQSQNEISISNEYKENILLKHDKTFTYNYQMVIETLHEETLNFFSSGTWRLLDDGLIEIKSFDNQKAHITNIKASPSTDTIGTIRICDTNNNTILTTCYNRDSYRLSYRDSTRNIISCTYKKDSSECITISGLTRCGQWKLTYPKVERDLYNYVITIMEPDENTCVYLHQIIAVVGDKYNVIYDYEKTD